MVVIIALGNSLVLNRSQTITWTNDYQVQWLYMLSQRHDDLTLQWRHNDHNGVSNHQPHGCFTQSFIQAQINKANLRDLIAATGLVISNWIKIVNFFACVTVKFYGWPRKTIGHFFYTTSSFVHDFKSIGEFKLDLQSRNAQFGSKLVTCYPVWPWNLMDDHGKQ